MWKLISKILYVQYNGICESIPLELRRWKISNQQRLALDDFEIVPYRYEERLDSDDLLDITGRVVLSEVQFKDLENFILKDSIKVIRHGISNEPLKRNEPFYNRLGP